MIFIRLEKIFFTLSSFYGQRNDMITMHCKSNHNPVMPWTHAAIIRTWTIQNAFPLILIKQFDACTSMQRWIIIMKFFHNPVDQKWMNFCTCMQFSFSITIKPMAYPVILLHHLLYQHHFLALFLSFVNMLIFFASSICMETICHLHHKSTVEFLCSSCRTFCKIDSVMSTNSPRTVSMQPSTTMHKTMNPATHVE